MIFSHSCTRKAFNHDSFSPTIIMWKTSHLQKESHRSCFAFHSVSLNKGDLHSISWMYGWIWTKLTEIHNWLWDESWLNLVTLIHFQGHMRSNNDGKLPVCTLSPGGMDGFWPNLLRYIVETQARLGDFCNLDPIFKITQGLRMSENGLSVLYLLNNWMDFN